jgi:hypothetical protein
MKRIIVGLVMTLGCMASTAGLPEVTFEYFNLSTNEIWVTDVVGLPRQATPGRLMTIREETELEVSASHFLEAVSIKKRIKIMWKDNGMQGWPGGLKKHETIPPGTAHQVDLKRDDLGIPAKLSSGKIRFTYLGDEKWRVKLYK